MWRYVCWSNSISGCRIISRLAPCVSRLMALLVDLPLPYSLLGFLLEQLMTLCLSTVTNPSRLPYFLQSTNNFPSRLAIPVSRLISSISRLIISYSRLGTCLESCVASVVDQYLCQSTCLPCQLTYTFYSRLTLLVSRLTLTLVDLILPLVDYLWSDCCIQLPYGLWTLPLSYAIVYG